MKKFGVLLLIFAFALVIEGCSANFVLKFRIKDVREIVTNNDLLLYREPQQGWNPVWGYATASRVYDVDIMHSRIDNVEYLIYPFSKEFYVVWKVEVSFDNGETFNTITPRRYQDKFDYYSFRVWNRQDGSYLPLMIRETLMDPLDPDKKIVKCAKYRIYFCRSPLDCPGEYW